MVLRRLFPISFITLLVFQSMGFVWLHQLQLGVWQHAQWEEIEEAMKAGRDLEGVVTLSLDSRSAVHWENAHEFRYLDALYDVLSIRASGDGRWEVRCIVDDVENRLRADFQAMLRGHDSEQGKAAAGLRSRLFVAHYLEEPGIALPADMCVSIDYCLNDWEMQMAPALPPEGQPPAQS